MSLDVDPSFVAWCHAVSIAVGAAVAAPCAAFTSVVSEPFALHPARARRRNRPCGVLSVVAGLGWIAVGAWLHVPLGFAVGALAIGIGGLAITPALWAPRGDVRDEARRSLVLAPLLLLVGLGALGLADAFGVTAPLADLDDDLEGVAPLAGLRPTLVALVVLVPLALRAIRARAPGQPARRTVVDDLADAPGLTDVERLALRGRA